MTDEKEEDPDKCPKSEDGKHQPNWETLHLTADGDEWYLDVNCEHCGRSGCVGAQHKIEAEIDW